jgi:NAD(P)-dependent dehydrogenase (short-subunit alcohol dehydrogenase family)
MRAAGAGWIVNTGSITSMPPVRPYLDYAKSGGDTVYASVKAALNRFTQGLAAELVDHNIAVNLVGPSTAIRTPGADQLIPAGYPCEHVEYLAETVLAMCHLPAAKRTGLTAFSMHYPHATSLPVWSLDGTTRFPPAEIPITAHPATSHDGL